MRSDEEATPGDRGRWTVRSCRIAATWRVGFVIPLDAANRRDAGLGP